MVSFIADDAFIPSFFAVQNLCYIVNQQANLNIVWGRIEANAVMNKLPSIYWNDLINLVNTEYHIINAIYILHNSNTATAHAFEIICHANQFKYFLYIQMWLWLTMWCKNSGLCQAPVLIHLPMDKMAAILQAMFSIAFSWMKFFVFWFHRSLFLRVQLTISDDWFR